MRKDGGPAFPVNHFGQECLTVRQYFAAAALQALIAVNAPAHEDAITSSHAELADEAYLLADAMLAADEAE